MLFEPYMYTFLFCLGSDVCVTAYSKINAHSASDIFL